MSMETDPTAVMGRRIGAVFIDGAIVYAPGAIQFLSTFHTEDHLSDAEGFCDRYEETHDSGFCVHQDDTVVYTNGGTSFGLLAIGMAVLMYVVLQGLTGWTIGKLATGIRVVGEDGRRAGFGKVLVRWLLWVVDGLPFLLGPLVGLITSLTTNGHRRVGDMVAKTYVVRKDAVGTPPMQAAAGGGWADHPSPTAKVGPQWDEARGTYIQWDPEAREWMQWDEDAKQWHPIITAPPPAATPQPPPPPPPPPPA